MKTRAQKTQDIEFFNEKMKNAGGVVVANYAGLTVSAITELRNKVRAEGGETKVMKNTLAKIAIKDTEFEGLNEFLAGQTVLIYADDPTVPARVANDFSKENENLEIIGGALPGEALDATRVKALASLPSLDQLRGKLVGLLQAPAQKLASVTQAPAGQLARVINAYSQKEGA